MVEACKTIAMGILRTAISEELLKALARKRTAQSSPEGSTLHSGARWGAGSMTDCGVPGGNHQGRRGRHDVDPRPRRGIRQHMVGTFRSVDCHALALGMLVDEDVVPQVEGLQCEARGKQSQQCDLVESRAHGSRYREVPATEQYIPRQPWASARPIGASARPIGASARPTGRHAGAPPDTNRVSNPPTRFVDRSTAEVTLSWLP